ncbi:MAG: hypothetical protein WBQ03_25810 [Candidatus Sulfotelmatobacter sp.]
MTFVKRDVETARRLYSQNPKGDFSSVVDHVRIFDFLQLVASQSEDNWIKQFDNVEDIKAAITSQFAYVALEYSRELIASHSPTKGGPDERPLIPFPKQLTAIADSDDTAAAAAMVSGLKGLHSVLSKIISGEASGKDEKLKLLWVLGRYGSVTPSGVLYMNADSFKQYAWGTYRGDRIFTQIRDFGVHGSYEDAGEGVYNAELSFSKDENGEIGFALKKYVDDLVGRFGDDGINLFKKADMTIYS